jgi:hypothetical protein
MGSNPSYFGACGNDCPVESVSWEDAQGFIHALNALNEGTYRLPTETEWEYACRAGSTTAFANGDITVTGCAYDPNLDAMGWYCYNAINLLERELSEEYFIAPVFVGSAELLFYAISPVLGHFGRFFGAFGYGRFGLWGCRILPGQKTQREPYDCF